MRLILIGLLLALGHVFPTIEASARPKTDVVKTDSGDIVYCEIKELAYAKLEVKSHDMGTINIEWAHIVALKSDFYFRVEVKDIGQVTYPYYDHPTVILPTRLLFALLSVLALVFSGIVAYRFARSALVMVLAPLLLSASVTYLAYSWQYLNVDMFGCFFAWLAILYLFLRLDRPGIGPVNPWNR